VRLARHGGTMGFFGSAGLPLESIETHLTAIRAELGPRAVLGANPTYEAQPAREAALVDLYIRLGVDAIEVSGFPKISPALVAFRAAGGRILAKVSSLEAARAFLLPPPEALLRDLVERGASVLALLPAVRRLRDALAGPGDRVHVGASGGIGDPGAVAAVAALGAEFVVLGSRASSSPPARIGSTASGAKTPPSRRCRRRCAGTWSARSSAAVWSRRSPRPRRTPPRRGTLPRRGASRRCSPAIARRPSRSPAAATPTVA